MRHSDLSELSNDELRQEIERRKIALTKPKIRNDISISDFVKLQDLCEQYIEMMAGGEYFKDSDVHISEAAVELFYGKDVWSWISKRQNEMDL